MIRTLKANLLLMRTWTNLDRKDSVFGALSEETSLLQSERKIIISRMKIRWTNSFRIKLRERRALFIPKLKASTRQEKRLNVVDKGQESLQNDRNVLDTLHSLSFPFKVRVVTETQKIFWLFTSSPGTRDESTVRTIVRMESLSCVLTHLRREICHFQIFSASATRKKKKIRSSRCKTNEAYSRFQYDELHWTFSLFRYRVLGGAERQEKKNSRRQINSNRGRRTECQDVTW